jgi:hypothetical protein
MHIVLLAMVMSYLLLSLSLNVFVIPYDIWHPTCCGFMKSPQKFSRTSPPPPTLAYYDLFQCSVLFLYSYLLFSLNSVILFEFYDW